MWIQQHKITTKNSAKSRENSLKNHWDFKNTEILQTLTKIFKVFKMSNNSPKMWKAWVHTDSLFFRITLIFIFVISDCKFSLVMTSKRWFVLHPRMTLCNEKLDQLILKLLTIVTFLATHICFVYCVITAVQNVRISLFPIGNLASNQIHNKLRNVMATANEFVGGVDFEAILFLFLFQTQTNSVSS